MRFIGEGELSREVTNIQPSKYNEEIFLEIKPDTLNLKLTRAKYDFARAKFPVEVGEHIKEETRYEDGGLYGLTVVKIAYKGYEVKRLLFRPDFVEYGDEHTYMEFHDLHKALESGSVTYSEERVNVFDAYKRVIDAASTDIIPPLEVDKNFQIPENTPRVLWGAGDDSSGFFEGLADGIKGFAFWLPEKDTGAIAEEAAKNLGTEDEYIFLDSENAVNFDNETPQRAIEYLNQTFNLRTWINREGEMIVGLPETNDITHIAAPRDQRFFRYKDPTISHAKEPVKRAFVEGPWADKSGINNLGDIADGLINSHTEPVADPDWDHSIKMYGIAERTDVDYGKQFITSTDASEENLQTVARLALEQKMKNTHSGSVEIDPRLSGTARSNVLDLRPGDKLNLVPNDKYFTNPDKDSGEVGDAPPSSETCGKFVNNETYFVNEVEHSFKRDGNWFVNVDVAVFPDIEVETSILLYQEEEEEILNREQLDDSFTKFKRWNTDG